MPPPPARADPRSGNATRATRPTGPDDALTSAAVTWNLRDKAFFETLQRVRSFMAQRNRVPEGHVRTICWAHNSHVGDARATAKSARGELNLGQLVRQEYGHAGTLIVGFSTHAGGVRAASRWGQPGRVFDLNVSEPDSYGDVLHMTAARGLPAFCASLEEGSSARDALALPRLERFVGVIYCPGTERQSHYLKSSLAQSYDYIIHVDETSPLTLFAGKSAHGGARREAMEVGDTKDESATRPASRHATDYARWDAWAADQAA